ncbi:hypothetical protein [Sphingomonas sp. PR090111-T3T-6A]|uniref:hypothetical protein n=1 Tax=Sphingomonas sp. PR090111-T3T-6A TaxID=685778 RepID=UPI000380F9CB|nr:hypothetical protein [Sphingomonas sp. PR090111-T3T-6A]
MVFTQGRYVVIDDDEKELRQLVDALHDIGVPCVALRYDDVEGVKYEHLGSVRLLFLDLHLTPGSQPGNIAQPAAVIVGMLEEGIQLAGGPYVIILWTKHEEEKGAFEDYLMARLDPTKRPLAVLALDKNKYMAPNSGAKLSADVSDIIASDPRLKALLHWEKEVLRAASATLSEIGAMVGDGDRVPGRFSERLDEVLSLLAREAIGRRHAANDPAGAMNAALMPILADRIVNQQSLPESTEIWQTAATHILNAPEPTIEAAAKLNTMLHLAFPASERMTSSSWGAVTLLPATEQSDPAMRARFDLTRNQVICDALRVEHHADRASVRLALIRIGASCDYAQNRVGPMPFVLGAIIPDEAASRRERLPASEFKSPAFVLAGEEAASRLIFNLRLQISLTAAQINGWRPIFRVRESLLMQITSHGANHATRPAIISFRGAEPTAPVVAPTVATPETGKDVSAVEA